MKREALALLLAAGVAAPVVPVLPTSATHRPLALASAAAEVQPAAPMNAAELRQALAKLRVLGSVLYVAAHPDDENTAFLTWASSGRLARTGYLSMTRGDGGQNLIGTEIGEQLGVIRTHELLEARRLDGAEQFFTRAVDFGYSKQADETLEIWGREHILADVVWVIRSFRPDVIVTRFAPDETSGHGHHTASAMLAEEAFAAAADSTRFREQLVHVRPWQAKRIVWNAFRFDPAKPDPRIPTFVTLDLGAYNPLLGRSYTEIAGESRSMHKSQGFGAPERRGPIPNYFGHRGGDPATADVFDGVDLSWSRVPGGETVDRILREVERDFRPEAPHLSVPGLVRAHAAIRALAEQPGADPWVALKRLEVAEAIRSCAGLWLEAIATRPAVSPGGEVRVQLSALNRSPAELTLEKVELPHGAAAFEPEPAGQPAGGDAPRTRNEVRERALAPQQPVAAEARIAVPADARDTQPYWLRRPPVGGRFDVGDYEVIGDAENGPALAARFVVRAGGERIAFERPVVYRWTDPVQGERYRPLEIGPPAGVRLDRKAYVFPTRDPREVRVVVRSEDAPVTGTVKLALPAGWRATPAEQRVELQRNAETSVRFTVHPPDAAAAGRGRTSGAGGAAPATTGTVTAVLDAGGASLSREIVRLDHPHLPIRALYPPAEAKLARVDVARLGDEVGYVMGSGDGGPDALRQIGYRVTLLEDEDLEGGALARFDAIVVGVRAYNTRPRLRALQPRLLDYVSQGGTLVVQYQTADRELNDALGPFPFTISRERVSVEGAEVRVAKPGHALLTRPNPIGPRDFEGWVQERGLYFASPWDPKYDAPLSANDPGEPPRDGGLLYARHGKGAFVYTGYSWFRQLPAGVPGAYRLFANLVSAGR